MSTPMGVAIRNAIVGSMTVHMDRDPTADVLRFTELLGDAGYYVAPLESRK